MLKSRFLSALVLLPVALLAIYAGSWPYAVVIIILTTLAIWEYVQLLGRKGYRLSLILALLMGYLWLAAALWRGGPWLEAAVATLVGAVTGYELLRRHRQPERSDPVAQWSLTLAGGLYVGLGSAYLLRVRALEDGLWWTFTMLPIIWTSESAAYFIGKRWGRHKMSPSLSPGKSWEGYAAQVATGLAVGVFLGWLWPALLPAPINITVARGLGLGGLLSTVSTTGDFFVSMLKREVAVKDSSHLIPGHGGVLDRIDSVLWAGFLTWIWIQLTV